jgi:hypothetical protein
VSQKSGSLVAAVLAASILAIPTTAFADGVPDPYPIGPHQDFVGLVNGQADAATIKMGCFGPTWPGRTGHPLGGQTVSALRVLTSGGKLAGNTGEKGRQLEVGFGDPSAETAPVLLRAYGIPGKIPVTLTLPCDGTGVVVFDPRPGSLTARRAAVSVTFASQP